MQSAHLSRFAKEISEIESKRELADAEERGQKNLQTIYLWRMGVVSILAVLLYYKLWDEGKENYKTETVLSIYERFVKENGLQERFARWSEK